MGSSASSRYYFDSDALRAYYFNPESDIVGKGNHSVVYKANLLQTDRMAMDHETHIPGIVAIKITSKKLTEEYEFNKAIQEAKFLSKFRHIFAVKVFEYFETHESLCVVMEYLGGGNLYQYMADQNGSLPEATASIITEQLAALVSVMAEGEYAHRDIRGDNIYFVDTKWSVIRLINFGNVSRLNTKSRLNKQISGRSTAHFLAPEANSTYYDTQIDVWAIGVLLYLMLSGTFPFREDQDSGQHFHTISKMSYEAVAFHHPIWYNVSNEAKILIHKMLTSDPEKRIKPQEILQDPWIRKHSIERIQSFNAIGIHGSVTSESREDQIVTPSVSHEY